MSNEVKFNEEQFKRLMVIHNNPHLYCAYQIKLRLWADVYKPFCIFYYEYFSSCLSESGLFKRKPDSEDEISHDEVLGALYCLDVCDPNDPVDIARLIQKRGYMAYSFNKNAHDISRFVGKHFDVKGVVDYFANDKVDYITQLLWAGTIIARALSRDNGWSHHLRTWIASEFADNAGTITKLAMICYRIIMRIKGKTLPDALLGYFNSQEICDQAKAIGAKW
jgi:hypothetical protein